METVSSLLERFAPYVLTALICAGLIGYFLAIVIWREMKPDNAKTTSYNIVGGGLSLLVVGTQILLRIFVSADMADNVNCAIAVLAGLLAGAFKKNASGGIISFWVFIGAVLGYIIAWTMAAH